MSLECRTIEEARENIDRLDQEIIKLLAERCRYVEQVARFKNKPCDIRAPARHEAVIARVRTLAGQQELDPDIVECVYRTMMECFCEHQARLLEQRVRSFGSPRSTA